MSNASATGHRRRVLVIANETCANPSLCTRVRDHAGHGGEVLVVAPVLNAPVRDEVSDDDARRRAEQRLARSVATLAELGLHPRGEVGDADPVRALQDALVELKQQERAMAARAEASERLADQIVGGLTSGLVVVDRGGMVQAINPAARRILGLPEGGAGSAFRQVLTPATALSDLITEALEGTSPIVRRTKSALLFAATTSTHPPPEAPSALPPNAPAMRARARISSISGVGIDGCSAR